MTGIMGIKRCGSCVFGRIIAEDVTKRLCHGAPPLAFPIPLQNGRMTVQMTRPVVSVSDEACALYQERAAAAVEAIPSQLDGKPQPHA